MASGMYKGKLPRKTTPTQGGLASRKSPKGYNENQLRLGIGVEAEHTTDKKLAMKIAMDHLEEDPQYYTRLPDPEQAAHQGAAMEALGMKQAGGMLMYGEGGPLDALKYLDNPMPQGIFGQAMKGLGPGVAAVGSAVGDLGGGATTGMTTPQVAASPAGQAIQATGQAQAAQAAAPVQPQALPVQQGGKYASGGYIPEYCRGGRIKREYGGMLMYEDGGNLLGLPEYSFGSWMGDNAGGILQGAGDAVSAIPVIGQIAGPILNMAGKITDGLVGSHRAKEAAKAAKIKERIDASKEGFQQQLETSDQPQYAAFQMGGDLMEGQFPAPNEAPVINSYDGNSNTHQQGVGGVPVDSRGNPSTVSKSSAVGLTEKGEVTWNGYVFSDKLTV